MKVALVTAFPPSRQGLNEYGFHIADQLRQYPGLELTVLADYLPAATDEPAGFSVIRCWGFNRIGNPLSLLGAVRRLQPDIVWFNLGFASFGGKPLPAFIGLMIPALTRLCRCYTHVTLHQLFETVNLSDAGVKSQGLYTMAGRVATHFLLSANSVSVLLPAYHRTLRDKYQRGRVHIRHHGIFASRPESPDFAVRGNPTHRILAFGKWGTYKRLEGLVAAFEKALPELPPSELIIAGGDHPKIPGYVQSVAERVQNNPRIRFLGYVPEGELADLFRNASLTVLPYTSSAGSSGVAHLACQYGLPILAPDIEDFVELAEQESVSMEFFAANNVDSLTRQMVRMLQAPERLQAMAKHNFKAALQMSMPRIIQEYIHSFDMHRRVQILKTYARLRKSRSRTPTRRWMMRQVERNMGSWSCTFSDNTKG